MILFASVGLIDRYTLLTVKMQLQTDMQKWFILAGLKHEDKSAIASAMIYMAFLIEQNHTLNIEHEVTNEICVCVIKINFRCKYVLQ